MGSYISRISVASAAAIALALPGAAVAAEPPPPPPPDTPSISQYVEQIPTSRGSSSPAVGKPKARALPTRVAATLRAHPDHVTKQLKKVATSSTYGAPQRVLPKPARGRAEPESSNALAAAVSAVNDSGDGHVIWLLLTVVFVTIAMVWAAARPRPR
jgi:hypothetical protein